MNPADAQPANTIIEAFAHLEAERERRWLDRAFIPPADFPAMQTNQSVIVFGARGAGKTALRVRLEQLGQGEDSLPKRLTPHWTVNLRRGDLTGSELVNFWLKEIHGACSLALARHIAANPDVFTAAPRWIKDTVCWYMQCYMPSPWERQLDRLAEGCPPAVDALLRSLFAAPVPPIVPPDAAPERVLAELTEMVGRLHLAGIWLLVDNLEPWVAVDAQRVREALHVLFATLELFESPGFCFKIMAPAELKTQIEDASGIVRDRIAPYTLKWSEDALQRIVERRLSLLIGREPVVLSELAAPSTLTAWLQRYGGATPRGWLSTIRPLVNAFNASPRNSPLAADECQRVLMQQPPALHIDRATGVVAVGSAEIRDLPLAAYRLLLYLYEHRPQVCPRNELYYLAYLGLDQEPHNRGDAHWELPANYNDILNTAVYRLRQLIEPDVQNPVYIITQRNKGFSLHNTW